MKRKLLFLLVLLTVGMGNLVWAQTQTPTATPDQFWRFYRATAYGEGQFDAVAKTLVIKTAAELAKFAGEVYDYDGYAGWTITLGDNIDLSAKYWQPIGSNNAFKGYFNGNGYTITGVKIDSRLISTDKMSDPATLRYNGFGLFGIVEGTVENVVLDSPDIWVLASEISSSGMRVAALVGRLRDGGTIRNCVVNGGTVHGKQFVGALVGQAESNGALTTIVGCKSSAEVSGVYCVGGLVGQLTGNASLRYSLYTGENSVTATQAYGGQLVGEMSGATASGESETEKNYFTDSNLTPKNSRDRKAYTVSCSSTDAELDFGPSLDYSLSGITAYEHILKYGGNYLAGADDEITFSLNITKQNLTFIHSVLVNGKRADKVSPTSYAFTMGNEDAVVTASVLADNSWDQAGIRADAFEMNEGTKTITITSAEHMGLLAYNVNNGINDYRGWTIEIGDAATASQGVLYMGGHTWVPIGTPAHPFRGTFDGKGKTISHLVIADTRWATNYTGLFGYVSGGTIKGVRLEGCLIGGNNYVGGIAGALAQTASPYAKVEDCNVDVSCVITGSGEYVGGIVGSAQVNTYVEGCVNTAPVQGVARVGGIVGQIDAYATVSNNIFNGLDGDVTATSGNRCAYIIGNINSYLYNTQNNYTLTSNKINDYDTQGYSVTSGNNNITLTFTDEGEATATYTTSGITAYADHLRFGGVYYAPKSETPIAVTLGYADSETAEFSNVTASSGTLTAVADNNENNSKHALTLNDENQTNCVITAIVSGGLYWTNYRAENFTTQDNNTITIGSAAELALLAYNVNNGVNTYEGYTITLSDNISLASAGDNSNVHPLWLPIGTNQKPFKGTFDGNGKTISGMNIKDGDVEYYAGLFGYVTGQAKIMNVKLANSNIRGTNYVGGIAGITALAVTIEDCLVGTDVSVTGATYIGGIVGRLYGTLQGCVSGASVKGKEETSQNNIGGIVGENASGSKLHYNVYNGTSVTGKSCVAAIIGRIMASDRSNNYFITPAMTGLNDFDRFAYTISSGTAGMTVGLGEVKTNCEFETSGLTVYNNGGFTLGNTTYGGDNETVHIVIGGLSQGTYAINANGDATLLKYHGTGFNITDEDGTGWFTLDVNDTDYKLTAVDASENFLGEGEKEDPYLIRNIYEMKQLALVVGNGRENYKNKYFRLENDLTYTTEDNDAVKFQPVGTADNPFMGYFDGNGKTISGAEYIKSDESGTQYIGIFGYIENGEVSHLKLSNSTFTGNEDSYVGGIVGFCKGTPSASIEKTTILDCIVDNNVLVTGKYVGGIAGWVGRENEYATAKSNVEGCVSAAQVFAVSTDCSAGGVIGWIRANQIQIKNCLYTGNSVSKTSGSSGYLAYCVGNYNTSGATPLDIYYTDQTLESVNGADRMAYTVTPATGLIISHVAPTVSYSLTGIQGYTVGLTYNNNYYATKGQTVTFTLEAENARIMTNVKATPDTGDPIDLTPTDGKYSFTIDNGNPSNYTIDAVITIDWAGTGTVNDPYIIDNIEKMNLLSERSQNSSFEGKNFRLMADLDYTQAQPRDYSTDVWTAIGNDENNNFIPVRGFKGTFDGNGHTISGVKVSTTNSNRHAGIFATIGLKSTVMNLTVTNSTFTSEKGHAGGIVGSVTFSNEGGYEPFIKNCHVGSDVTVTSSKDNYSAGGIVGNQDVGQLKGCTSAATVSQTGSNGYAGGIVGSTTYVHTKIHENIYLGNSITATKGVADAINARPTKAEELYANFYTDASLTSSIGSQAYEYTTGTYNATAANTYEPNGIARYDNNLLKYNGTFYSKFQKGDANGDGKVNITDTVAIVDFILGNSMSMFNAFAADGNGDGKINITDTVFIVDQILGNQ